MFGQQMGRIRQVDERRIRVIASQVTGVREIDKCRIRRSGFMLFVEIHVVVDGDMPVRKGHDIAHLVKDILVESSLGVQDVTVHIEPPAEPEHPSETRPLA